jgi:c(7)-type cytochrome triheme protein
MQKNILLTILFLFTLSSVGIAKLGDMVFDDKAGSLKKAGVNPAVFPHGKHEDLYKCEDCHPKIFKDKRGANDITMQKNISGEFCGNPNCHNSPQAFPLYMCKKCHIDKK